MLPSGFSPLAQQYQARHAATSSALSLATSRVDELMAELAEATRRTGELQQQAATSEQLRVLDRQV